MNDFMEKLRQYIGQQNANYGNGDAESLLEMLYLHPVNGFDNDAVRKDFEELYEAMNGYSLQEIDRMIYPVCTLCCGHKKTGFIHGVQVGTRLAQELAE